MNYRIKVPAWLIFLFLFFTASISAGTIPDHRDLIINNFKRVERALVSYIVSLPTDKRKIYLNIFKPYYRNQAQFDNMFGYEKELKKLKTEIGKKVNVKNWDIFNNEEFKKICLRYLITKLYANQYITLYNEYNSKYSRQEFGRALNYLKYKVQESFATSRDLIGALDEKIDELVILLRNNAIYTIRRSFSFTRSSRQLFEQHTIGNVFKMLNVYKGKFANLRSGIMVSLAKYRLQSTADKGQSGFAIILNFAPIKKEIKIKQIKTVPITVMASSGIELIKELFNTASEKMVAIATIESLSSSVTTKQWKTANISSRDIVASKAFILGFRVINKRKFTRKMQGKTVKYIQATVSAKIGLPKLKDISFSPTAKEKLKRYRKMVKEKKRMKEMLNRRGHYKKRGDTLTVEEPLENNPRTRNSRVRKEKQNLPENHPDNDADLPDVIKREEYYRREQN